jgi:hypothetical protein
MNAAVETLRSAIRIGVMVDLDGEDLILEADEEPPASVLEAIREQKPAIVALLRRQKQDRSAEGWTRFFRERTGIAQNGGLSREQAEAIAFECCLVEWLNRHPVRSPPGKCVWCGRPEDAGATVVPFGVGEHHAWLHPGCWAAWHAHRRAAASLALAEALHELSLSRDR